MVRPMKGITQKLSGEWQAVQEERLEISTIWWISQKKKKEEEEIEYEPQRWVSRKLGDRFFFLTSAHKSLLCVTLKTQFSDFFLFFFYPSFSREFLSSVVSWHEVSMQEIERHGQDIKRHAFPDRGIYSFICAAVIYLLEMKGPFFFFFLFFLQPVTC